MKSQQGASKFSLKITMATRCTPAVNGVHCLGTGELESLEECKFRGIYCFSFPFRKLGIVSTSLHIRKMNRNGDARVASKSAMASSFGDWQDGEQGVIWEGAEIAQAVGGVLMRDGFPGSICTDTRRIHKGEWFLALAGPNYDGNEFLPQALTAGCVGAIGRSMPENWPVGFVEVPDALQGLHKLAACVRKRYKGPVVGITGSCGKTTTRAMTALALESLGHVHQAQGNLNNHIGLPLTLLKMPSHSSACVLEMGMNHSGEILELSNIARPSIRVILNVGPVHMQNFRSLEDVAAAKGELLLNAELGDVCILNADDPLVTALPLPAGVQLRQFGRSEGSHVRLLNAETTRGGRGIKLSLGVNGFPDPKVQFEIPSPGLHLATNACAAACIATSLGVHLQTVAGSISRFSPVGMRSRLEVISSEVQLINDAYNANPMSMTAALKLLASLECKGRKVVALGDMLELGAITKDAHVDILKCCQELHVSIIGTAGPAFSEAWDGSGLSCLGECEVLKCENATILAGELTAKLKPGDAVLVKGSRGMRMEVVVHAIKSRFLLDS